MGSMEQKVETPREKTQERGSVFSMTRVNTEIILSWYILITWIKVIKMHRKMKKNFSVMYTYTYIYTSQCCSLTEILYTILAYDNVSKSTCPMKPSQRGKYSNKNSHIILF